MSQKPATIAHYVNGHVVAGGSARQQAVFNPATGVATGQVALANAADVDAAVAAANCSRCSPMRMVLERGSTRAITRPLPARVGPASCMWKTTPT